MHKAVGETRDKARLDGTAISAVAMLKKFAHRLLIGRKSRRHFQLRGLYHLSRQAPNSHD